MAEVVLKVVLGDDLRRLKLKLADGTPALKMRAIAEVAVHGFSLSEAPTLKYMDPDGDVCTLVDATVDDFLEVGGKRLLVFPAPKRRPRTSAKDLFNHAPIIDLIITWCGLSELASVSCVARVPISYGSWSVAADNSAELWQRGRAMRKLKSKGCTSLEVARAMTDTGVVKSYNLAATMLGVTGDEPSWVFEERLQHPSAPFYFWKPGAAQGEMVHTPGTRLDVEQLKQCLLHMGSPQSVSTDPVAQALQQQYPDAEWNRRKACGALTVFYDRKPSKKNRG